MILQLPRLITFEKAYMLRNNIANINDIPVQDKAEFSLGTCDLHWCYRKAPEIRLKTHQLQWPVYPFQTLFHE